MTYRPYPNRERALRQVQRTRDAHADFLYRDVPQRYVLGIGQAEEALHLLATRLPEMLRTSRDRTRYKAVS